MAFLMVWCGFVWYSAVHDSIVWCSCQGIAKIWYDRVLIWYGNDMVSIVMIWYDRVVHAKVSHDR